MDGVGGLTQPHIQPGKRPFVYEFRDEEKAGTFMYPPRISDEMVQMAMGMMGNGRRASPATPEFPSRRPRLLFFVSFVMSNVPRRSRHLLAEGQRDDQISTWWTWECTGVSRPIDPLPCAASATELRCAHRAISAWTIIRSICTATALRVTCTDGRVDSGERAKYPGDDHRRSPVGAVRVFGRPSADNSRRPGRSHCPQSRITP